MSRERGAIGWAGVLLSGAAVGGMVPAALCAVGLAGWVVSGVGPDLALEGSGSSAVVGLFLLLWALAPGAAAAALVRLLGFGRTRWTWTWVAGAKALAAMALGGFAGFWLALGIALAFFPVWFPLTRGEMDAFLIFPLTYLGAFGAGLAGLICPVLWAEWAARRSHRDGDEPPLAAD